MVRRSDALFVEQSLAFRNSGYSWFWYQHGARARTLLCHWPDRNGDPRGPSRLFLACNVLGRHSAQEIVAAETYRLSGPKLDTAVISAAAPQRLPVPPCPVIQ